jgi:tRNA(Ile)-lysidine synthase
VGDDAAAARRRIVRSWRALTGGPPVRDADRPTLLAVSGGADSSALAFALAGRAGVAAIGHVVHDLRPRERAEADRQVVERLGRVVGLPVLVEHVRVEGGNAEAAARRVRYAALSALARRAGCRHVAAAHQADDVLETMLANLIRGAGPRGLRGPAPRRSLEDGVTLVRPMLRVTRAQAVAICRAARWAWAHDGTNDDPGGHDAPLRAALRARVLPVLEGLRPGAAERAARAAEAVGEAVRVVEMAVDAAWGQVARAREGAVTLDRAAVLACPAAVREGLLRRAVAHLGGRGQDGVSAATVRSLAVWFEAGRGERVVGGVRFVHEGATVGVRRA